MDLIREIDLHGLRHKQAMELVQNTLAGLKKEKAFSLTIITGNSSTLQERIFNEALDKSDFTYYIPSWNLGQIIVEQTLL